MARPVTPLARRVWTKVSIEGECWRWNGTVGRGGYGQVRADGRMQAAHRVVYEMLVAPIPQGLTLDHLCRNPWCVRPCHLEPCTMWENTRRGDAITAINARKTECNHGHPFDGPNTYRTPDGDRNCRTCHRARQARRREIAARKKAS